MKSCDEIFCFVFPYTLYFKKISNTRVNLTDVFMCCHFLHFSLPHTLLNITHLYLEADWSCVVFGVDGNDSCYVYYILIGKVYLMKAGESVYSE